MSAYDLEGGSPSAAWIWATVNGDVRTRSYGEINLKLKYRNSQISEYGGSLLLSHPHWTAHISVGNRQG
jgi:hypothetical protein